MTCVCVCVCVCVCLNFYWSIVDLQCCVRFCCTAKWISYTYIHFFLDSFPIQVTTEHWVEFPGLYSRFLLIIYFIYSTVCISYWVGWVGWERQIYDFAYMWNLKRWYRWTCLQNKWVLTVNYSVTHSQGDV